MRARWVLEVAIVAVLLALCGVASAEPVKLSLPGMPATLVGVDASVVMSVELDPTADRIDVAKLELVWQESELLDRAQSTLTVEVDGQPRRTLRLREAARRDKEASMVVTLAEDAGGFHQVRVRARLLVDDEDCNARHPREAWLRLLPAGNLTWQRRLHAARSPGIADLVRSWQQHRGDAVDLVPTLPAGPAAALAFLEADALLRAWGMAPRLRAQVGPGPALVLRVGDGALPTTPDARAVVRVDREALDVAAQTPGDLRDAVLALRSDTLRDLCPHQVCFLGAGTPAAERRPEPAAGAASTRVLTLRERGYPQGWAAVGPGEHVLRFAWQRPPEWTVTSWPEIDLPVTSWAFDRGAGEPSRATLKVNGLPVATWSLGADDEVERLVARLPRDLWDAQELAFELLVELRAADARCGHAGGGGAPWLVLGRDGELRVPRRELRPRDGIGAFYRAHRGYPPPLAWSDTLDWPRIAWLAAILSPLRSAPDADVFRMAPSCPEGACIVVAPGGAAGPLVLARSGAHEVWKDTSGSLPIPLLPAGGTVVLSQSGARLSVGFPSSVVAEVPPPPPGETFVARHAVLSEGKWTELAGASDDAAAEAVTVDAPPPAAAVPSPASATTREETRLRAVDAAGLVVLAIVLALGVRWIRRGKKVAGPQAG